MHSCTYQVGRRKKWLDGYIRVDEKRVFLYDDMETQLECTLLSNISPEEGLFKVSHYFVLYEGIEGLLKKEDNPLKEEDKQLEESPHKQPEEPPQIKKESYDLSKLF